MNTISEKKLEFYKDIQFTEITVSGRTVKLPFLYYDFSRISANFPAPTSTIKKILPSKKLEPVEIKQGTTTVMFIAYEYRKMEGIAPYKEFGVGIPTTYKDNNLPGSYVTHLPVTTEQARWGGVEIYGYPKFIADITFEDKPKVCSSQVKLDNQKIVSLEVNKKETRLISNESYVYTILGDKIVRTLIQWQGYVSAGSDKNGAKVELGTHPISREIKALGFEEAPLQYTYSPMMQMLLNKPGEFLPM